MSENRGSSPDFSISAEFCVMKMKRGLSIVSAVICMAFVTSIAVFSAATHAAEDRTFDSNAMAVRDRVDRILITEGYCANSNDCRKKKIVFFNPRSDGFDIYVYGINDQSLVNRIVIACLEERLVAKFNFSVRSYSASKDQELSRSMWNKPPYSEFTFKLESK